MEACTSTVPVDRRSKVRYPVQLNVRYRATDPRNNISGIGLTLNMSSGGLLVMCQHDLRIGTRIEVQLDWPSKLNSTIPLKLVTVGSVVRSQSSIIAIKFCQYEFRTMRSTPPLQPAVFNRNALTVVEPGVGDSLDWRTITNPGAGATRLQPSARVGVPESDGI